MTQTGRYFQMEIDPWALILPHEIYVKWNEGHNPHVPKVAEVAKLLQGMKPEQRNVVIERAKALTLQGRLVEEAAATIKATP